jgi:hypothetical protein
MIAGMPVKDAATLLFGALAVIVVLDRYGILWPVCAVLPFIAFWAWVVLVD